MPDEGSISVWLGQLQEGDSLAAQRVWERYFHRLVGLARVKLRASSRRAADEEDVALSAFQGFFAGVQQGRFPKLDDRQDLWNVLFMLTERKAINLFKYDTREKRGGGNVRGESAFAHSGSPDELVGINEIAEPTPEQAGALTDTCSELLEQLGDENLKQIALWKLEGYSNDDIAGRLSCNVRTVERKLRLIRELWSFTD